MLRLQSGFGKMVLQVLRNDWARAFALGALNVSRPGRDSRSPAIGALLPFLF